MRKLKYCWLVSAIALTFFTNRAKAQHECTIERHPNGPTSEGWKHAPSEHPCTSTRRYTKALANRTIAALNDEILVRTESDNALGSRIDTERTASIDRDDALGGRVDTERTASIDRDNELDGRVDTERTASIGRDDALSGRIDTERIASIGRDDALDGRVDTERIASIGRDNALGSRIDENAEAIEDAIALSVAIPDSRLSPGKNFSLALGGGFTDGSSAIGGIGTLRFSENFTAYGGGSGLVNGGTWAAKVGAHFEW